MVEAKLCAQCRWHGFLETEICCDYLYITGHARIVLPPREDGGCPVFEVGEREFSGIVQTLLPPAKTVVKRPMIYNEDIMRTAYDNGGTDGEIAAAVGCTKSCVRSWRERNELEAHLPPPPGPMFDREAFWALYRKGSSDTRIALLCGCSPTIVRKWRRKNNLPVQEDTGAPKEHDRTLMRRLYDSGMNDRQIAEAMGCSATTVCRWRTHEWLIAQRWRKQGRDDE